MQVVEIRHKSLCKDCKTLGVTRITECMDQTCFKKEKRSYFDEIMQQVKFEFEKFRLLWL